MGETAVGIAVGHQPGPHGAATEVLAFVQLHD
jgi:hypothetical protein